MLKKDYSNLFRLSPKDEEKKPEDQIAAGAMLKMERLNRGLSLAEVAAATSISVRSLQALEEDDREHLPAQAFVRGFIIIYSKYLGLKPDEIVSRHMQSAVVKQDASGEINARAIIKLNPIISRTALSGRWLMVLFGVFLLLAVLLYWGYTSYSSDQSEKSLFGEKPAMVESVELPVIPYLSAGK